MDKRILCCVCALVAAGAFAFTRNDDTNVFVKGAVEYSQRGRLGTADYVPVSTNLLASDVNALTNDVNFRTAVNAFAEGKVLSVNGQTGVVVLDHSDVGAIGTNNWSATLPSQWSFFWPNADGSHPYYNYIRFDRSYLNTPSIDLYTKGDGYEHELILDSNRVWVRNGSDYRAFPWTSIVSTNDFNRSSCVRNNGKAVTSDAVLNTLDNYTLKAYANSTYLAKTNAAAIYLSKAEAPNTYLMKTNAAAIYLKKTDAAAQYANYTAATNIAAAQAAQAVANAKPNYIYKLNDEFFRTDQNGNKQYRAWNGVGINWVNANGQVVFNHAWAQSGQWSATNTALGNVTMVYDNGTYYIQQYPMVRFTEDYSHQCQINLRFLGAFTAVLSEDSQQGNFTWNTYGKFVSTDVVGNDEVGIGAGTDWIYNQGTWFEDSSGNELYWNGNAWTFASGGTNKKIEYLTGSCAAGDASYKLTITTANSTNTYQTGVFDSHYIGHPEDYVFTNGNQRQYFTRNINRGTMPRDDSIPDWARAETPPESMDYEAVTNISTYVATNQGFALAANVVPNTRKVNGQPLTSDITIETPTDYEAITNTVNAVKAQFYDEPLQVNWTLKMVNGEMKLYATTNVNMSTL